MSKEVLGDEAAHVPASGFEISTVKATCLERGNMTQLGVALLIDTAGHTSNKNISFNISACPLEELNLNNLFLKLSDRGIITGFIISTKTSNIRVSRSRLNLATWSPYCAVHQHAPYKPKYNAFLIRGHTFIRGHDSSIFVQLANSQPYFALKKR